MPVSQNGRNAENPHVAEGLKQIDLVGNSSSQKPHTHTAHVNVRTHIDGCSTRFTSLQPVPFGAREGAKNEFTLEWQS